MRPSLIPVLVASLSLAGCTAWSGEPAALTLARAELTALEAEKEALEAELGALDGRLLLLEAEVESRPEAARPEPDPDLDWVEQRLRALEDQPRLAELCHPSTTPWQPAALPLPPGFGSARGDAEFPGAGTVLAMIVRSMGLAGHLDAGAEVTLRAAVLPGEEEAVGVILQWGLPGTGFAGRDYRVLLQRREDRWLVRGVETRVHHPGDCRP